MMSVARSVNVDATRPFGLFNVPAANLSGLARCVLKERTRVIAVKKADGGWTSVGGPGCQEQGSIRHYTLAISKGVVLCSTGRRAPCTRARRGARARSARTAQSGTTCSPPVRARPRSWRRERGGRQRASLRRGWVGLGKWVNNL